MRYQIVKLARELNEALEDVKSKNLSIETNFKDVYEMQYPCNIAIDHTFKYGEMVCVNVIAIEKYITDHGLTENSANNDTLYNDIEYAEILETSNIIGIFNTGMARVNGLIYGEDGQVEGLRASVGDLWLKSTRFRII